MPNGVPVVIAESGGYPVTAVAENAPLLTISPNGFGWPITLVEEGGAPFIVAELEEE